MIHSQTVKTLHSRKRVEINPQSALQNQLPRYAGDWSFLQVAHLYRRTTFGARPDQIEDGVDKGMDLAVSELLSDLELPKLPINLFYPNDPAVPIGETWVGKPYLAQNQEIIQYRRASLNVWTLENLFSGNIHIREKMTLFWHNHFVTQATVLRDPNLIFYNINILRGNALGNFKTLVDQVTINPAMLVYLNGNQNTHLAPNENYARELLELFTIGKGELAGPGDYTTFTEKDVAEIARILTGWRDTGIYSRDDRELGSFFRPFFHDSGTKQLSHRFNNVEIANNGDQEYKDILEVILARDEVSKFICRKIYRWFVYYEIDEQIEDEIIGPLASIFRENNYEIKPVLEALLTSDHFYGICAVGPMIKNPLDFISNLVVQFNINFPEEPELRFNLYRGFFRFIEPFQMNYYEPPNVAGWKAYYQEPLFYRTWINSVTLPVRQRFTEIMASGLPIGDFVLGIDVLDYISKFNDPFDPNSLIAEFVRNLFPEPITDSQVTFLKEILIPGLPDFEWTVEYGLYVNNPGNPEIRRSVETKLRAFLRGLLSMPEYYLS